LGTINEPFKTIMSAINYINYTKIFNNVTIHCQPGIYECDNLIIPNNVNIVGESKHNTILKNNNSSYSLFFMKFMGSHIIKNVSFDVKNCSFLLTNANDNNNNNNNIIELENCDMCIELSTKSPKLINIPTSTIKFKECKFDITCAYTNFIMNDDDKLINIKNMIMLNSICNIMINEYCDKKILFNLTTGTINNNHFKIINKSNKIKTIFSLNGEIHFLYNNMNFDINNQIIFNDIGYINNSIDFNHIFINTTIDGTNKNKEKILFNVNLNKNTINIDQINCSKYSIFFNKSVSHNTININNITSNNYPSALFKDSCTNNEIQIKNIIADNIILFSGEIISQNTILLDTIQTNKIVLFFVYLDCVLYNNTLSIKSFNNKNNIIEYDGLIMTHFENNIIYN